MHNFGDALKYQRELAGLTQPDLAKKIGTSQANISRWESGEVLPNIAFCTQLATFYGITVDELFGCNEFSPEEKAAGATDTKKISLTADEYEMLMVYRELGERFGKQAQKDYTTVGENMLKLK